MLALLSWRVWAALIVVAALAASHYTMYRKGVLHERTINLAAVAEANNEARRLENARQSSVDSAAILSRARQQRIATDSANARTELDGMRSAADAANARAEKSAAAANQYRATCTALLKEGAGLLEEIAGAADQHSSDVKLLLDAWPK